MEPLSKSGIEGMIRPVRIIVVQRPAEAWRCPTTR
jgi:hypothetical protein